ncbi:hypothetical protein KCV03_g223, partial [Aureobasidium melanogenum]
MFQILINDVLHPVSQECYRSVPVLSAGIYDLSNEPSSLGSDFETESRVEANSDGNTIAGYQHERHFLEEIKYSHPGARALHLISKGHNSLDKFFATWMGVYYPYPATPGMHMR